MAKKMIGSLVPCYGRDYANLKAAQAGWDEGRDFRLCSFDGDGTINKEDALAAGYGGTVQVRFARQTRTGMLRIEGAKVPKSAPVLPAETYVVVGEIQGTCSGEYVALSDVVEASSAEEVRGEWYRLSAGRVAEREEGEAPRVDVLCKCGWGRYGIVEADVPQFCPVCRFDLWGYAGRTE